jgi:hypothetical protein
MPAALFAMTFFSASAQQHVLVADTSEVRLAVRDTTGAPVQNADVSMVFLSRGRDQSAMDVKTDQDGKIEQDIIPVGDVVQLHISAPGYQAFGVNYPVNGLVKDLVVRLKPAPLVQTASLEQPKDAAANAAQATFTYKEPQWVTRHSRHATHKTHVTAKSSVKASSMKNEVSASKPSASVR